VNEGGTVTESGEVFDKEAGILRQRVINIATVQTLNSILSKMRIQNQCMYIGKK